MPSSIPRRIKRLLVKTDIMMPIAAQSSQEGKYAPEKATNGLIAQALTGTAQSETSDKNKAYFRRGAEPVIMDTMVIPLPVDSLAQSQCQCNLFHDDQNLSGTSQTMSVSLIRSLDSIL